MTLEEIERQHIMRTLAMYGGNRTHAARALGISVRTLHRRLSDWGIQDRVSAMPELRIANPGGEGSKAPIEAQ